MRACPDREAALALLKTYNSEPFHIQHALTVEGTMRWYAQELGYHVLGAVNTDFFSTTSGVPIGIVIEDGRKVRK